MNFYQWPRMIICTFSRLASVLFIHSQLFRELNKNRYIKYWESVIYSDLQINPSLFLHNKKTYPKESQMVKKAK